MILKNLFRRKIRTLLTVVAISIGVAAIVAMGAMADGLKAGYGSMLSGSKADLVISQPDAYDISFSVVDEQIGEEIAVMPEVAAISGMLQGWSQTEGEPFFFIFGYPEDSFVLERFQIIEGVDLNSREAQFTRGKPLILGSSAAEVLEKAPGDTMRLSGSAFRIVGIYQTGDAFEDSAAIMRLADAQEVVGKPRQVGLFYIQLKDPSLSERFVSRVERKWTEISISGIEEFADQQIMQDILEAYVWVIGGLAILIGGVGMMNSQLMAVSERTREIGVLRAVGWSSKRVLGLILGETILVSLAGGLMGVAIGWLLLYALSSGTVFMGLANADLSRELLIQAFIVVVVLGLVGGLYPAWRAARLQPIEALRYEGGSSGSKVRRLPVGGMALQSLWQRSLRTLLTLGAIGLTVGSILALQGIMSGMMVAMTGMFSGTEIMIRQDDIGDTSLSTLDERIGEKIAAMSGVQSAGGMVFSAVMLPDAGAFFIVWGFEPNGYAIQRFNVVEGAPLKSNHQVLLGRMMADALNKDVGDTIELSGTRFKIIGIYESQLGMEEMGGVLTLRDAQALLGKPRKVTMYAVKLNDPSQAELLVSRINDEFPDAYATLSGEFAEQMPDFQSSDAMISGISFMALFVGGVGVLNTMLMAVFERTREIGVLRSLGWRRRAILGMVLREALWLGVLGGIAGVVFALGLVFLITKEPTIGVLIEPLFEWSAIARTMIIALLLGLLGGLYPGYRATRMQPVEALRYE
ncbi:MAG: ABC transporter permease [Anaerolineales bacterium]|nr:ABC transporter permease [Anaerolineales bacterium]